MAFELDRVSVTLTHKNERLEKHGDEEVLACDLNFSLECSNSLLAMFHPTLRWSLYDRPSSAQGEVFSDADHTPVFRYPGCIGVLRWGGGNLDGATVGIDGGTKATRLEFDEAKCGKYRIECKEGGTVVIMLQVSVYPTGPQSGVLSQLLQQVTCLLSVTPGEPKASGDLVGDGGDGD